MFRLLVCVLMLGSLTVSPVRAGERPLFTWPEHDRLWAQHLSDATVYGAIGYDTFRSLKADDKPRAFLKQGCSLGASIGIGLALKGLIHRDRPDHSNDHSFPSGHTANSMASGGVAFAIPAGVFRMGAKKHFGTDVLGGLAIGTASRWLCRRDLW